jgi:hypothetical protein
MLKKLSSFIEIQSSDQKYTDQSSQYKNSYSGFSSKNSKNKNQFDFIHLIQSWKEIAGSKLSEHTIPLKNQNGSLIILSNHSAFANEMKFMEIPLKKKIFQKFPNLEQNIKTIQFIVDSTHFEVQKNNFATIIEKVEKKADKPHPFSPEYKKLQREALELFNNVEDEELKKSLTSLYVQSKLI